MSKLLYRRDIDEVRGRLSKWWNGGDIGRPAMCITAPRDEPWENIEAMPQPQGRLSDCSAFDFNYCLNLAARGCINNCYLAEAVPAVSHDLLPNCLALYLGCKGVEQSGTVWCEPFLEEPDEAKFKFEPQNFYWDFTLRLAREELRIGKGRFLVAFPDLIEGLDTLSAMRGMEKLLYDIFDRPDWVHQCLRQITDLYFHYYDILYDMIRDEVGGSYFWAWAPGRIAKFQCDVSAMIGPDTFREFMVPVLTEMTERVSYSIYHWDGPDAIPHHDHILSIPNLTAVQWTPGAAAEPVFDKKWWPLYHKTIESGKKMVLISLGGTIDEMKALKKEFGQKLKHFMIIFSAESQDDGTEIIKAVSD